VGYLAFMQGDPATTEQYCAAALECARLSGDAFSTSMSLLINGAIARFRGAFDEAHAVYEQALSLAPEQHGDYVTMTALYHMGELARLENNYDRAIQLYEESEALAMRHGDTYNLAYPAFGLGHIALLRGDFPTATSAYRRTLAIWQDLKDRGNIRWALEGLGWCASFEGRAERAARLLGAAEALGELLGSPLVPHFMAEHERALAKASAELGAQAFTESFEAGRGLSLEAALREALDQADYPRNPGSTASWSPLTDREREVAQLVANGLSNRSIAETLILGTRTVESHISRILSKLRLSSRAQLAVWADQRMSLGPQRRVGL
jgi:non-specific serine/threonine protein kinase